ncbi:hypothetical protein HAX54_027537 [Datura stramonium]|uniref:Uncharacterized protein n=1 Tax=Datura stramonium TaxID=4076 RepID=A0ABS8V2Z0_DATST|nr:hypothetical protein [Datura stramonium]
MGRGRPHKIRPREELQLELQEKGAKSNSAGSTAKRQGEARSNTRIGNCYCFIRRSIQWHRLTNRGMDLSYVAPNVQDAQVFNKEKKVATKKLVVEKVWQRKENPTNKPEELVNIQSQEEFLILEKGREVWKEAKAKSAAKCRTML